MNKLIQSTRKNRVSKTVESIPPSGIRRFFDLASSMDDVISLGVGEPDFVTPWHTREAAIFSLERGYTTYTSNNGLPELRQEIANYLAKEFQTEYNPENEIIITVGASEAIDLACRAILDPGDEVLIVEPCFVAYEPLVRLAGGVPISILTTQENSFKLTPELIEENITARTKAIMISFPNNPTGSIMTQQELVAIADVIEKHDLLVISDEIYAELTYDQKHTSFAAISKMWDRTILVSGFSKAFAMTGWRVGYVCAPEDISQAMLKIHQYAIMCAPIMAQKAALEALQNGMEEKDKMIESYKHRRNYIVKAFQDIGLSCHQPEGAFYAFPSIRSTGLSSTDFAERLLLAKKVAVVPGGVFGASGEGFIRCSYATSLDSLQQAIQRIGEFCDSL